MSLPNAKKRRLTISKGGATRSPRVSRRNVGDPAPSSASPLCAPEGRTSALGAGRRPGRYDLAVGGQGRSSNKGRVTFDFFLLATSRDGRRCRLDATRARHVQRTTESTSR